ncbi:MAG: phosphopyruvate hydratase [Magnetovibrio sp.]|nr:phosphopyruvate hydratase [Magnetovibrio sp.]
MNKFTIKSVHARRVWDSRGEPTIETEVTLRYGAHGRAITPAGASKGSGEVLDLRDGGKAFGGRDVMKAVSAIKTEIAPALNGLDAREQTDIDKILIELDGTKERSRIGGNAITATSMAVLNAAASAEKLPLWRYLAEVHGNNETLSLPLPEIQIFGGGVHAAKRVDVQDFMVIAIAATSYAEALEWSAEIYRHAGILMENTGRLHGVADEGGFWPAFNSNEEAIETLIQAIECAGFTPGQEIALSLDIAASEFGKNGHYTLACDDRVLDSDSLSGLLVDWIERYPIISIEDPLAEDDIEGFTKFTWAVGKRVQVVGDDFLVTNAKHVAKAAKLNACNALLVKPNQAGTITETKAALDMAEKHGYTSIISARSGETADPTIVHLAVGWGVKQIKVGSFSRSERMVKWNEEIRIAEAIGQLKHTRPEGALPAQNTFPWIP